MKVKFKNLKGEIIVLELPLTEPSGVGLIIIVLRLAAKAMRIIHKGKNLPDKQTLLDEHYE